MFGGVGLYSGELFFALIDDDVLFFKVDDVNREDYVSRGMKAFMPIPDKASMGYFQVPEDVIEEADDLVRWARRSVEVAQRAGARKQKKKKQAPARQK
jgi:DNA transformation protein